MDTINDWLNSLRLSPGTVATYSYAIRHFLKHSKDLSVESFLAYSGPKNLSAVRSLFDYLCLTGTLNPTQAEVLRFKRAYRQKKESRLPKTPKLSDLERMRALAVGRDKALIELLFSTGCRQNEIRTLVCGRVNLAERTAVVLGKGNKERIVFFSEDAKVALEAYWKTRNPSPNSPAITRQGTESMLTNKSIWQIVKKLAEKAGCGEISPHWFRHGFGTRMLEETGNLALVQDLLGHASPVSTRVYAQVAIKKRQEAVRQVYG